LFVFHLRGLKPPGGSELAIVFPGLKAGAIEEDNNQQLSLHRNSNAGLICLLYVLIITNTYIKKYTI